MDDVLRNQKIMWSTEDAIKQMFSKKAPFPQKLADDIATGDSDEVWAWFFSCFEITLRRFISDGCNTVEIVIPLKLQEAIIARAQRGKFDEIKRYIALRPFDQSLHFLFWRACRKHRDIIADYVERYPLRDDVLDRFWHNADEKARENYIDRHIISREMAEKMWQEVANGQQVKYCKRYLKKHQLPEGIIEDNLKYNPPYLPGIVDLIDYSAQPFVDNDEVLLLKRCSVNEIGFYFSKFGRLSLSAQKVMVDLRNEEIFRLYAKHVGYFDVEVQRTILSPEFLGWEKGKELVLYFLTVSKKPMDRSLIERLNNLFG